MNILSQRDPKWASDTLGTKGTIGEYGCTITCISIASNLTPPEVNQKLISVNGYANGNLIIWSKIKEAIPWLEFEWRSYTYENDKVTGAITKNGFCLVEVDGSRIGGTKHWVLYVGGGQMLDPYYGTQKTTSYYPATGYAIINKIGEPVVVNTDLQKQVDDLKKEVSDKNEQIKNYSEQVSGWEKKYNECNTQRIEAMASADGFRKQLNELVAKLATTLGTRQEIVEIISSIDTLITYEDKALELEKRIEIEEREHSLAVKDLGDQLLSVKSQLASLEIKYKELQAGIVTTSPKKTIWEVIRGLLGI